MGLMFNHRRQSQDRIVRQKINEWNEDIYMNHYSYELYKDDVEKCIVDDHYIENCDHHFCLVEDINLKGKEKDIDSLVLFYWNRKYPADVYLDIDLTQYTMIHEEEFEGSSHAITMRVYERKSHG